PEHTSCEQRAAVRPTEWRERSRGELTFPIHFEVFACAFNRAVPLRSRRGCTAPAPGSLQFRFPPLTTKTSKNSRTWQIPFEVAAGRVGQRIAASVDVTEVQSVPGTSSWGRKQPWADLKRRYPQPERLHQRRLVQPGVNRACVSQITLYSKVNWPAR